MRWCRVWQAVRTIRRGATGDPVRRLAASFACHYAAATAFTAAQATHDHYAACVHAGGRQLSQTAARGRNRLTEAIGEFLFGSPFSPAAAPPD